MFATGSDGVRVALHVHPAVGARKGVLLVTHAMMASSTYQARFCDVAAGKGFTVYRMDFRGHGTSKPPDAHTGDWSFSAYVERDLPAAIACIKDREGVVPDYVGHSLGGLVGLAAFASGTAPAPSRLVLVASTPWVRSHRLSTKDRVVRRAVAFLFRHASRPFGYLPIRLARAGSEDEPKTYGRDLAGWIESQRWPWLDRIGTIPSETLFVYTPTDPFVRPLDAELVTSRLAHARTLVAPAGDHMSYFRRDSAVWEPVLAFLTPPS